MTTVIATPTQPATAFLCAFIDIVCPASICIVTPIAHQFLSILKADYLAIPPYPIQQHLGRPLFNQSVKITLVTQIVYSGWPVRIPGRRVHRGLRPTDRHSPPLRLVPDTNQSLPAYRISAWEQGFKSETARRAVAVWGHRAPDEGNLLQGARNPLFGQEDGERAHYNWLNAGDRDGFIV